MITGFNHSGFVVKDIDKMVAFYRDLLGLTVLRDVDSKAPPEGDHTGIPGAHRTPVFVGKTDGDHALERVHFIAPASPPRAKRNRLQERKACRLSLIANPNATGCRGRLAT